jgi:hypothetical protein
MNGQPATSLGKCDISFRKSRPPPTPTHHFYMTGSPIRDGPSGYCIHCGAAGAAPQVLDIGVLTNDSDTGGSG